jgi:hypothetical protein
MASGMKPLIYCSVPAKNYNGPYEAFTEHSTQNYPPGTGQDRS